MLQYRRQTDDRQTDGFTTTANVNMSSRSLKLALDFDAKTRFDVDILNIVC